MGWLFWALVSSSRSSYTPYNPMPSAKLIKYFSRYIQITTASNNAKKG
jgi:hypothetical protein